MKHRLAVWLRKAANRLEPLEPYVWRDTSQWTNARASTDAIVTYTIKGSK